MKKTVSPGAVVVFVVCTMMPQPASGSELDISGFFDVTSTYQDSQEDRNEFGLGQAELDIESELSQRAAISVAVAYNSEDAVFELGAAELGLNLWSNENSSVSSVDLTAGQFDVPFGIDYNWYPTVERKLVTPPMVVDLTHGGWNDLGFKLDFTSSVGNLVIFAVNGFESSFEVIDQAQSLATGVPLGEEVNTTPAQAWGGRLDITPVPNLEIGGSYAVGLNQSDKDEMVLMGGDFQYSVQKFDFKGEYIVHSLNRSIAEEENQGYYVQSIYNIDPVFLVGRYGSFQPDGADWYPRYTLGVGYVVTDGVELRFETAINDNSNDNTNILQLVAGF